MVTVTESEALTIPDLAERAGLSTRAIEYHIRNKNLKTDKIHGRHLISPQEAERFLESRAVPPAEKVEEGWMTVSQASRETGLVSGTIRHRMFTGKLPYKRDGWRYLVKRDALMSYKSSEFPGPRTAEMHRNRPPGTQLVSDVARELGLPRLRVYQLVNDNDVQSVRVGRNIYVPDQEVARLKTMNLGRSVDAELSDSEQTRLMDYLGNTEHFMTAKQSAEYLGITPESMFKLIRGGYVRPRLRKIANFPSYQNEKGMFFKQMLEKYGPLFQAGELDILKAMRQYHPDEEEWVRAVRGRIVRRHT